MDGRLVTVLVGFVLPLVLLAVDIAWYATNPLVVLILFSVMVGAACYLLTYAESFGGAAERPWEA
jgi:hypothetical protein